MTYFLGVDVSKLTLDLALVLDGTPVFQAKIANQSKTITEFLNDFKKAYSATFDQLFVCMEYTGIYNAVALETFHKKAISICLEPALQIKQSQGMTRGKSDKVDALRIAQYAFKN